MQGGHATHPGTEEARGGEPQRTCIGCGAKRPKKALFRLVLSDEGQPSVDAAQRAKGRGAYLCGEGCLKAAAKRKAFQRAFRREMKSLSLVDLGQLLSKR